ncbi:U-box domain-containing protein 4-like isoform X2 [Prosopis cineraria]|uniref:U-box domain-containing protein 4-like isoform X2 n=1 Tax=Prosopis cineraria TaxID=364024 RepID=UPI0024104C54|nr:U-box domain-containing protein 4-like isoform X2 [Prosopis cineraria]
MQPTLKTQDYSEFASIFQIYNYRRKLTLIDLVDAVVAAACRNHSPLSLEASAGRCNSKEVASGHFNRFLFSVITLEAEKILKLLKPILEAIIDTDFGSDEVLQKIFEELSQTLEELRELFGSWQLLCSKIYNVLQIEFLISKIQILALAIFKQMKASHQCLANEFNSAQVEHCIEKIKNLGHGETSSIIKEAIMEQVEGLGPSSEVLEKIIENLGLSSNQEVLIEAVTLEKFKENAEQIENFAEAEYLNQIITLATRMHESLIMLKQAQSYSPVPVPLDFCCPLSLELMKDPVIVSSGQTYERAFIKNWIDLGLDVCPKTRQTLTHTNLIPNYTVKALITNWCELNNVKLRDPIMSLNLNHCSSTSEGSSSDITSRKSFDILRISQSRSDDIMSTSLDEMSVDLVSQDSPYTMESSNAFNSEQSQADLALSNENFPQGNKADSSSSMEVNPKLETTSATVLNAQREPEFSAPSLEARPQVLSIWQHPPGNLRLASSLPAIEIRPSPSGIETQVQNLAKDLKSSSIDTQREATEELRLLAKHNVENRIVIANCGVISPLVDLLQSSDTKVQENAVTALLNLSINDNNKTAIANAGAIDFLIHVLGTGCPEAKENSAATLYSLSMMEENRIRIGRSGAIKPLVDLLANGTSRGKKDASTALFNLSIFHENKGRIVQAGAVKYLVELMDPAAGMADKAVAVLANLASIPEGRTEIVHEGAIPILVDVIELGSTRGKENAAATLLHICSNSSRFLSIMIHEGAIPPLVALSLSGTPRAKEKAQALLNHCRSQRHGSARRG